LLAAIAAVNEDCCCGVAGADGANRLCVRLDCTSEIVGKGCGGEEEVVGLIVEFWVLATGGFT